MSPLPRRRFVPPKPMHRINHMIRVPEVRLIDVEGEPLGVVATDQARTMAREAGFDLVEISPTANPPVCRIMDYGKFKYEQKKKKGESKRKQHQIVIKELRIRPKTGEHDIEVKLRKAREFLEEGNKVSFLVLFRGREVVHGDIGISKLRRMAEELADVGKVERAPRMEGRRMMMLMSPTKKA